MPLDELPGYSVLGPLGAGGTAELFLAERRALGGSRRRVALKRTLPALAQDPLFRELFLHEARLAMQLSHRNVVQVYDIVEWSGSTALVMEYVEGCDLRALLRDGPLTIEEALFACVEVLRGLDYAHRRIGSDGKKLDVVHRDVAPGNILISREGEVKLADFGLARSRERLEKSHGGIKGTFAFMAPEQAEGTAIDARADVFACGAIFYAMLTGKSPFDSEGPLATLEKVRAAEFEPIGKPEIDAILKRALCRAPGDRFASAAAMQAALEELAHEQRIRLDPAPLARRVCNRAPGKPSSHNPGSFSATMPSPRPERVAPLESSSSPPSSSPHTKVLKERPRRRRAWPWALALGAVAAGVGARQFLARAPSPPPAPHVAPVETVRPPAEPIRPIEPPAELVKPIPELVKPPVENARSKAPNKPKPKPGYLTVSVDPWAYVFVDGRRRGTTPLTDLELPPGPHEVTLENPPLGASQSRRVNVVAGEHHTLIERLTAER